MATLQPRPDHPDQPDRDAVAEPNRLGPDPVGGLPLHEQLWVVQMRQAIDNAGEGNIELLRELSHRVLNYGVSNRCLALSAFAPNPISQG